MHTTIDKTAHNPGRSRRPFRGFVHFPEGHAGLSRAEHRALCKAGYLPTLGGGQAAAAPPRGAPAGVIPALPFVASAHEHTEPAFTLTVTPTTGVQQQNPIDVPAYGYIRHILLEVSCAGGTIGTGVANADFPFSLFSSINLQDVNGANIFGPVDGYATYLANLFGGFAGRSNPVDSPFYVGSAPNPVFYLRIPVEISHKDGLGALNNQNSAANFKLNLAINSLAGAYSTVGTVVPGAMTIKGWLEAWTLPAPVDGRNRPQAQQPPMLGTGQLWSSRSKSVAVGNNTVEMTRVGNLIRSLIFIARDATGARVDTVFPDPVSLNWDGMAIHSQVSQRYLKQRIYEQTQGVVTLPAGVYAFLYNTGGPEQTVGNESPDLWLPTSNSSRLEITGNSAVAGTVQVLTNEVAPVEQDQAERYMEHNATAWNPAGAGAPYAR